MTNVLAYRRATAIEAQDAPQQRAKVVAALRKWFAFLHRHALPKVLRLRG